MSQNLLYYTVNIGGLTNAAPGDGFIDNNLASSYIMPGVDGTYDMEAGWAANLTDALAKARANIRWRAVLDQLSFVVSPYSVQNITATGATSSAAATSMVFTVVYDRPDYLYADDELNPGTTLYNDVAIKRWVARALIENINFDNFAVLDPTAFTNPNFHYGQSLLPVNAGPLAVDIPTAEAAITVTFDAAVSGTTAYPI